jgi:hypothetical protein
MSLFISYNREQKDFADKVESAVNPIVLSCTILMTFLHGAALRNL